MTDFYINDQKIDIDEEQIIAATYGNISFGDFAKKRGISTNNFKIPITNRNKQILENAELFSSDTNTPYNFIPFRVEIGGVEVNSGKVVVNGTSGRHYNLNAIGGMSEFYSVINTKKLIELDLSEYDHDWNQSNIVGSWTNTKGYIYPYVKYGLDTFSGKYPPDYFFPQTFLHTVVRKICEAAGYTAQGDVLNDSRFLKHLIGFNRLPETYAFEAPIHLSDTLPDVTQSKIILDFMNCYGLMAAVNNVDQIITFSYIDNIIFSEPIDWSDKVDTSEEPEKELGLDFLYQNSTFSWNTDDVLTDGRKYTVEVSDAKADSEGPIYKSGFFTPGPIILEHTTLPGGYVTDSVLVFPGMNIITTKEAQGNRTFGVYDPAFNYEPGASVFYNGTYYQALKLNNADHLHAPTDAEYWKPVKKRDIFNYKPRNFYGILEPIIGETDGVINKIAFSSGDVVTPWKMTAELLDWSESYRRHYQLFDSIKNKPKKTRELIKVKYSDVNQIDFTRPYILGGEYGEALFVLEEITQFKLNKSDSTYCNFIQINMKGIE